MESWRAAPSNPRSTQGTEPIAHAWKHPWLLSTTIEPVHATDLHTQCVARDPDHRVGGDLRWLEPLALASNHGFGAVELNRIRRTISSNLAVIKDAWTKHCNPTRTRIKTVRVTDDEITAYLWDGRTISVPIAWSWRLSEATPQQPTNCQIIGGGEGVHWPDVDEDISIHGMLHGIPAPRPA